MKRYEHRERGLLVYFMSYIGVSSDDKPSVAKAANGPTIKDSYQ